MKNLVSKAIATGLGSGLVPIAPGTFGTVGMVVILYLLWTMGVYYNALLIVVAFLMYVIGVVVTNVVSDEWGKDPGKIVIDEWVGMTTAILFVPFSLPNLIMAFVLFRIFDIAKPWGVSHFDKMEGAHGVMMDDVVAGVYANIVLQILLLAGISTLWAG